MPVTDDLQLLIDAAQAAAKIATRFFHGSADHWEKPGGQGPVTEADLAVDTMLRQELTAARPDYGWLSEETQDSSARLGASRVFIVDPIDGTRSFMERSTTWAHSLAIANQGRIEAAVVYLPLRDKLYVAGRGLGASLNGSPIAVHHQPELSNATVLATKANFAPDFWAGGQIPPVQRKFRSSLAYRLSLVGEGRFDAMLTLRPTWEWDVAAGSLIVEEARGTVSDLSKQPALFNSPGRQLAGIIAAAPDLHNALITRLAPGRVSNLLG